MAGNVSLASLLLLLLDFKFAPGRVCLGYLIHTPFRIQSESIGSLCLSRWKFQNRKSLDVLKTKRDDGEDEPDLFDYFDPLLSPHAYPNGITPNQKPVKTQQKTSRQYFNEMDIRSDSEEVDPLDVMSQTRRRSFLDSSFLPPRTTATEEEPHMQQIRSFQRDKEELPLVDPLETFDPTLSPHAYSTGSVPDVIVGDANAVYLNAAKKAKGTTTSSKTSRKLVGILLMDHGSRNAASNERLHALAQRYQTTVSSFTSSLQEQNIIVQAAHMEIASPSIPEGLEKLVQAGVDEIVCHPYFLSPGRHVTKDIPRIVADAIEELQIEIPVITTEPVGSSTDLMIGAIHALVQSTAVFEERNRNN